MLKKKNNGFTLIELLTVIVILSLISGITIYIVINVINNSKNKGYETTVNNIENVVSSYLLETKDNYIFKETEEDSNLEYHCVSVEKLVEKGYFDASVYDSYVYKNRKVLPNDYVYVERDKNTKSIIKSKYLYDDIDKELCDSINPVGEIMFITAPEGYSKYKDITIKYSVRNYYDINNYKYEYTYSDDNVELLVDEGNVKKIRVNNNGTVNGIITGENDFKKNKSLEIIDIDRDAPIIKLDKEFDAENIIERSIKITISDSLSGLKSGGLLEYGWSDSNSVEPTYEKANLVYNDGVKEIDYTISKTGLVGIYYLWIKADFSDMLDNRTTLDKKVYGGYKFVLKFKVNINKDNGINTVTESGMYIVGSEVTVSASVKDYYKFNGWSGYINSNDTSYKFVMPAHDVEINANSLQYKCNSGELIKDSLKGYICVGGDGVTSKSCDCVESTLCAEWIPAYSCRVCYCDCLSGAEFCGCCTNGTCGGYCSSYYTSLSCSTCYECIEGWNVYSGSGSSLKCYVSATT